MASNDLSSRKANRAASFATNSAGNQPLSCSRALPKRSRAPGAPYHLTNPVDVPLTGNTNRHLTPTHDNIENKISELCRRLDAQDAQVERLTGHVNTMNTIILQQQNLCDGLSLRFRTFIVSISSWKSHLEAAVRQFKVKQEAASTDAISQDIHIHGTMLSNLQNVIQTQQSTIDTILEASGQYLRASGDTSEWLAAINLQLWRNGGVMSRIEELEKFLGNCTSAICDSQRITPVNSTTRVPQGNHEKGTSAMAAPLPLNHDMHQHCDVDTPEDIFWIKC